jgi:hypothetical protein
VTAGGDVVEVELVVYPGLTLSDQICLDHLAAGSPRGLTFEQLDELIALAGKALGGARGFEREGLTLDQQITLRGLVQSWRVERLRRGGDVRIGGRDSRPPSRARRELSRAIREGRVTPEQRELVGKALGFLARGVAKEVEQLSYGLDEPPELRPRRSVPVRRPVRAGRRVRRGGRRLRSRARAPARPSADPALDDPRKRTA